MLNDGIHVMAIKMFKKIKSLFKKSNMSSPQTTNPKSEGIDVGEPKDSIFKDSKMSMVIEELKENLDSLGGAMNLIEEQNEKNREKNYPITSQIMTWLDKQDWKYDHRTPSDGETHHIVMGFSDRENDWTCVFRINESNQLVTVFGILENSVPVSHYTAMLMELAKLNVNVGFGSIEFDPADGEVRAKVAFDVEFNALTDKSLGCYLQAVAGLTEVARNIMHIVLADDEPSQFAGDYIDVGDEVRAVVDDEKRTFFLPTRTAQ